MKEYKIPVMILGSIFLFIGSINFFIYIFYGSFVEPPPHYNSIVEFEKETNIKTYQFYDVDEFINHDQKILLEDSHKGKSVCDYSKVNKFPSYHIETQNNGVFFTYSVYFDSSFAKSLGDVRKDIIGEGTFYQHHFKNETGINYVGNYVKPELYYRVIFENNTLDTDTAEEKFIDYIKLVEEIN